MAFIEGDFDRSGASIYLAKGEGVWAICFDRGDGHFYQTAISEQIYNALDQILEFRDVEPPSRPVQNPYNEPHPDDPPPEPDPEPEPYRVLVLPAPRTVAEFLYNRLKIEFPRMRAKQLRTRVITALELDKATLRQSVTRSGA